MVMFNDLHAVNGRQKSNTNRWPRL